MVWSQIKNIAVVEFSPCLFLPLPGFASGNALVCCKKYVVVVIVLIFIILCSNRVIYSKVFLLGLSCCASTSMWFLLFVSFQLVLLESLGQESSQSILFVCFLLLGKPAPISKVVKVAEAEISVVSRNTFPFLWKCETPSHRPISHKCNSSAAAHLLYVQHKQLMWIRSAYQLGVLPQLRVSRLQVTMWSRLQQQVVAQAQCTMQHNASIPNPQVSTSHPSPSLPYHPSCPFTINPQQDAI